MANRGAIAVLAHDRGARPARLVLNAAGLIAAAMLMLMPAQRAHALSPASPATVPLSSKFISDDLIEVRGGGHGGGGHGGGFHGGFHGGGFHGGGFRGGFVGRPGFVGHRAHFHGRRFVGPRFYGGYYPYAYRPRCRVIWTYYGPRRICRWHHRYW
jgi:hypothetical protein